MERWKFGREFKIEAVRLVRERGAEGRAAARDLTSRTRSGAARPRGPARRARPRLRGEMLDDGEYGHPDGHGDEGQEDFSRGEPAFDRARGGLELAARPDIETSAVGQRRIVQLPPGSPPDVAEDTRQRHRDHEEQGDDAQRQPRIARPVPEGPGGEDRPDSKRREDLVDAGMQITGTRPAGSGFVGNHDFHPSFSGNRRRSGLDRCSAPAPSSWSRAAGPNRYVVTSPRERLRRLPAPRGRASGAEFDEAAALLLLTEQIGADAQQVAASDQPDDGAVGAAEDRHAAHI